jgi:hypothetical protein
VSECLFCFEDSEVVLEKLSISENNLISGEATKVLL